MHRNTVAMAANCLCAASLSLTAAHAQERGAASASQAPAVSPFPPQIEAVVPFEPTAFASDGKQILLYELMLRSFERETVDVREVAVLDADATNEVAVARFDVVALRELMRTVGPRPAEGVAVTTLAGGSSAVVYVFLAFDSADEVPARLRHRLRTSAGEISAAAIATHDAAVRVLAAPLRGSGWLAETGLSNDNGHRRGHLVLDGQAHISRRYAFDWMQVENGETYAGDRASNAAYFSYGEPVVAVADARVASIQDGIPENTPGARPAVAMTYETVPGNRITLDLGGGHFAHYMHLKPGSIAVRSGDRVRRGEVLGRVGNAGDSFAPHLHFEITTSSAPLAGEGVPYVLESFETTAVGAGVRTKRRGELPREKMLVDFGE